MQAAPSKIDDLYKCAFTKIRNDIKSGKRRVNTKVFRSPKEKKVEEFIGEIKGDIEGILSDFLRNNFSLSFLFSFIWEKKKYKSTTISGFVRIDNVSDYKNLYELFFGKIFYSRNPLNFQNIKLNLFVHFHFVILRLFIYYSSVNDETFPEHLDDIISNPLNDWRLKMFELVDLLKVTFPSNSGK